MLSTGVHRNWQKVIVVPTSPFALRAAAASVWRSQAS